MPLLIIQLLFAVIMCLWTHSFTVSCEVVCPSWKSNVCSTPYTNINNMSMSTSATIPSKAMKTIKRPRKVLRIAHVNICSLRNKDNEINILLVTDDIHILTISETHWDNTFDERVVAIHGYNIYRKYRNAKGGGVAVYIQNHIPVKLIADLMLNTVEVILEQIHLPHLKPILVGSCYRPPSDNSQYLETCEKCLIMYVLISHTLSSISQVVLILTVSTWSIAASHQNGL